jgi:hypothetical protein
MIYFLSFDWICSETNKIDVAIDHEYFSYCLTRYYLSWLWLMAGILCLTRKKGASNYISHLVYSFFRKIFLFLSYLLSHLASQITTDSSMY